jgi:hypothetical protein
MNVFRFWLFFRFPRLASSLLLITCLAGAVADGEESEQSPGLSDITLVENLKNPVGGFSDLIVKLKKHPEFSRLCEKHGLDDPAVWAALRNRFVLNHASLQGYLSEAESMMEIKDRRSALDDKLISAEEIRAKGRDLRDQLAPQMDELREMLRLIDEMEAVLEEVSRDHALTGEISIENKSGQSIAGQVLLIDGKDLIVKRGEAGYFRVRSSMLSDRTKRQVMEEVFTEWPELPEIGADDAFNDEDSGELIAYDESQLYLKNDSGEFFYEQRSDSFFSFMPYEQQLESAREAIAIKTNRKDPEPSKVEILENALALNQSRLATIDWYEDRLGLKLTESERD